MQKWGNMIYYTIIGINTDTGVIQKDKKKFNLLLLMHKKVIHVYFFDIILIYFQIYGVLFLSKLQKILIWTKNIITILTSYIHIFLYMVK